MKKYIITGLILFTTSLSADLAESMNYQMNNLSNDTLQEMKKDDFNQKKNKIYRKNLINEVIEKRNIPDFQFKRPKVINVFVRKDYHIIDNNFIVLDNSGWKKMIVKEKQEWEY